MIKFAWIAFFALVATAVGANYAGTEVSGYPLSTLTAGAALLLLVPLIWDAYRNRDSSGKQATTTAAVAKSRLAADPVREAEVARNVAALKQVAAPSSNVEPPKARVDGRDGHYLEVETVALESGAVEVIVTAYNYSGNRFHNHVREKLTRIKGVKWSNPINLGKGENDRRRQMKGTTAESALPSVMSGIAAIR